jgi:hypothetical protein
LVFMTDERQHHFNLRGRTFYDKGPFRPVARPGASGTIGQQVVPPAQAGCRSLYRDEGDLPLG